MVTVAMANTGRSEQTLSRAAGFLACLLPATVWAANDWNVTSGLTLEERYTDNVSLTAGGGASSFVTQITPRIGMARNGKRGRINLAYSLQGLLYDHDVGNANLDHSLLADMQVEPITGVLTLSGSARVAQQYASQFGPTSTETYHTVANRVGTRSLNLTPNLHNEFFERRVITDVNLPMSYASSDSGVLSTSTSKALNFTLRNGQRPDRLTYALKYNRSSGESNGVSSAGLSSHSYNLGYVVFEKTRVFVAGGQQGSQGISNLQNSGGNFQSIGTTWNPTTYFSLTGTAGRSGDNLSYSLSSQWVPSRRINLAATIGKFNDSQSYNLSGSWAPSALTSLSASIQQNFNNVAFGVEGQTTGLSAYGSISYALTLSHRRQRSAFGLNYSESVVDASQQFTQTFTTPVFLCPDGIGGFTAAATQNATNTCIAPGTTIPFVQLVNQTTLNKIWAGTYNRQLGRSTLAFTLSQNQRQYLGTGATGGDKQQTVTARWSLPLSSRTSTSLGGSWSHAEASIQDSDSWSIDWTLAHRISTHVSSGINARHSEQTTNTATGNTKENTVSAQLGMTF